MTGLVDTHCHLGDERFADDLSEVVERARVEGVTHAIVIGDSVESTEIAVGIARRFQLSATAGVHPHTASRWSSDAARVVRDAADEDVVVAIGETGLDYHYDFSPRDVQRRAFEEQLSLGTELGLPVVVHAREADEDVAAMVQESGAQIVLHSFSAGSRVFEAGLEVDAYFSFSGMVTFKSWRGDGFVAECPLHRLLVETDAPYLAPVPHRGHRNEPAFVRHVAERIATVRGLDPVEVSARTTQNATTCFGPRMTMGTQGLS